MKTKTKSIGATQVHTPSESKITDSSNNAKSHLQQVAAKQKAKAAEAPAKRSVYRDTGMATTVDNVQTLAETLDILEPPYTSPNPLHGVAHLVIILTQAMMFLTKVASKVNLNKVAIDNRHLLFDDLKPFCTRLINAIVACGASKDTVRNARFFMNNLYGVRVVKPNPDEADPNLISVSHQSYVQQVQHFQGLVFIAIDEPLFEAPTPDLEVVALQAKLAAMIETNKEVTKAQAVLNVSRMERNIFFNAPVTGLVDICLATKNNVKAIYGAKSPQYLIISGLAFSRIR